jgi:FKBP-type peptidyl-prolyl cis-trans isomerase
MNFRRLFSPILLLPAVSAFAADSAPRAAPVAAAYPIEAYVSLGSSFARDTGLDHLGWTEQQFNAFIDGVRATYRGQGYVFTEDASRLRTEVQERLRVALEKAEEAALDFSRPERLQAYMKDRAKEFKLQFSDSGLAYRLVSRNSHLHPGPEDLVVFSCQGVTADGRTPVPALALKQQRVKVADLLPGLAEAVQMMTPEGSALVVLPPDLSFAAGSWPEGLPPGSPVICMLQLHEIVAAP